MTVPSEDRDAQDSGTGSTERSAAPWRGWTPGTRVMVRRTLPAGSSHLFTDVLGTIVSNDTELLVLLTRAGQVSIPAAEIAVGKPIPPAPPRRRPRSRPEPG